MPLDNYTKDFFKDVKSQLHNVTGRLDKLIGIADRPVDNGQQTVNLADTAKQETYAAVGKAFLTRQNDAAAQQQNKSIEKWYRTLHGWKTRLELIAIPFAIMYAIVTFFQWHDLSRNFQMEQRAWVGYSGAVFNYILGKNQWQIQANMKNIGHTPALKFAVTVHFSRSISDVSIVENPDEARKHSTSVVFPDVVSGGITDVIDESEFADISTRKGYLYGTSWYSDIFGKPHWSQFCIEINNNPATIAQANRDANVLTPAPTPESLCAFHNNTDDTNE